MRILYLTSTFHPAIGGAETYALNLALGLGALGHNIRIVTDQVPGMPEFQKISENVVVNRLEKYRRKFEAKEKIFWEEMQFGLYDEILEIVDELKPDIVLSNSLNLCVPSKIVSFHLGKPWVATFHEQAPEREAFGNSRLRLSYEILEPDAVIAGSRFYFERAQKFGRPHNSHLIYHGIDTEKFQYIKSSDEVREHYKIPKDNILIISAGRLKPRKGFPDLIHAVSLLKSKGYATSLIIAGSLNSASLSHLNDLELLVRELNLTQEINFDDKITYNMMPWLLSGSDIVVQPSLEEGLGLSVIEAMSCSRPVVTTRIPGIMEIMTSEGIAELVEPKSSISIASSVEKLILDKDYGARMGSLARQHVVQKFSIQNMVKQTEELFFQLLR